MKHILPLVCCVLVLCIIVDAQIPNKLSYQGLLTGAIDGTYALKFDIYNAPTAGSLRHTETFSGVSVLQGTFSVILGSTVTLLPIFSESLYVEITATAGPTGPTYPLMFSPRSALTSSPYSLAPWSTSSGNLFYNGGNVGIGTTSPLSKLHVSGGHFTIDNGDNASSVVQTNGDLVLRMDRDNNDTDPAIDFQKSTSAYLMRVKGNGNVGIGTPNPQQNFAVSRGGAEGLEVYLGQPVGVVGLQSYDRNASAYAKMEFQASQFSMLNGNVGIGVMNPNNKFMVNQTTPSNFAANIYTSGLATSTSYGLVVSAGTGNSDISFQVRNQAGVNLLTMSGDGNIGIGVNPSTGIGLGLLTNDVEAIQAISTNPASVALYVQGADAAFFDGGVSVHGTLSKTAGSFKIDHPLNPENKYLSHSFVESPDMMNIYNGNVTTDANGDVTITLPDWFEALNKDFRYQLTIIGKEFAQAVVSEEITNNHFAVRTDKPNVKVSWQVTGIRHDAYADAHRIPVEEMKPVRERGYYQFPELYGQPEEKSIEWVTHPEIMKQVKAEREKQSIK